MIRIFAIWMMSASALWADQYQACVDRYFPVTDVQLSDSGRVAVQFRNDTPYPVVGYGITYVFETANGVVTDGFPGFFLKNEVRAGDTAKYRIGLGALDVDLAVADVMGVTAHVSAAYQMVGVSHEGPTPLDILLKECEEND